MPPISIHHGVLFAIMTKRVLGVRTYRRECRVRLYPTNTQSLRIGGQQ